MASDSVPFDGAADPVDMSTALSMMHAGSVSPTAEGGVAINHDSDMQRRLLPYLIPLAYMVLALWITYELDEQNHLKGRQPRIMEMREQVEELCIDDASP